MRTQQIGPIAVLAVIAGCAGPSPDMMAQETTRAVYADDLAGTTKYFDGDLKEKVTRQTLGDLSDRMHSLGTIKAIKPLHADKTKGEYEYTVDMDKGALIVFVRLDQQHRISVYRVNPAHP